MLRGENASAKSLHSVVQSLESDKVKLELKVKNLELQLKENKRQLSSSSGKMMTAWRFFLTPLLPAEEPFPLEMPFEGSCCTAPDLPHLSLALPLYNQMRASHDPGPTHMGVPGIRTLDLPVVLHVGRNIPW